MTRLFRTTAIVAISLGISACSGDAETESEGATDAAAAADAPQGLTEHGAAPVGEPMAMGDDSSPQANNGNCQDPRFTGRSSYAIDFVGRDATDCQAELAAGEIEPNPVFATPASLEEINYGDDSAISDNDGRCDDFRFTGDYAATIHYFAGDAGHDASDCRAAVEAGTAHWQGNTATPNYGIKAPQWWPESQQ